MECEAIPRCWVSRSRCVIKWPPSFINFESAIDSCMAPLLAPSENAKWTTYALISCTRSVSSLTEAQQLATDLESDDRTSDEEGLDERSETMPRALGRGHRLRIQNSQLLQYETEVP